MPTAARMQQRYDHRLRDLVQRTGDVTIATDLGVPRSTARGWLGQTPNVVVTLDATDLRAAELQQEVVKLRRRVKKLTALLRLALALLRSSGFTLTHERLPDGRAKIRILLAVDRARAFVPVRALLRFLRVSPSRFHAWQRLQHACALDDQSSCPLRSPHRLTPSEIRTIEDMVTAPEYRHVPTGTLAVLAQRFGKVWASPATWYRLVRKFHWRRPRLRVHPAKPTVGLRTTRADEMWHIDTTVIRLLDGTRVYLHAVIDNFSRRILAWRVAETFAPVNSVAVLVEAGRGATPSCLHVHSAFFGRVVVMDCLDLLTVADGGFLGARLSDGHPRADDQAHDDGPSPATLRPSAPRTRSPRRGPDHRHGSGRAAVDGPRMASHCADRGDRIGRGGPVRARTPPRGPEASPTR